MIQQRLKKEEQEKPFPLNNYLLIFFASRIQPHSLNNFHQRLELLQLPLIETSPRQKKKGNVEPN